MSVTTTEELEGLRRAGALVADVLRAMLAEARPGITTAELDALGERLLDAGGGRSAPRLTYGFPGATCISLNDEIAHGVPGERVLREGDLVNVDVSAELDGYWADTGASTPVGDEVPAGLRELCRVGRRALAKGVRTVRTGRRLAALGRAVEREVRSRGFEVIRDLADHGVGRALHEEPGDVQSWFDPDDPRRMTDGLVFTVEPMVSPTARRSRPSADGWTLRTEDGSPVVQYEHTVVATRRGPIVLTLPSPRSVARG